MKRSLVLYTIVLIISVVSLHAQTADIGNHDAPNAVEVTSSRKLNMRLEPSASAGIVTQIEPGSVMWVTDVSAYHDGWVKATDGVFSGYVSTDYIKGRNADYYSYLSTPHQPKETPHELPGKVVNWILENCTDMFNSICGLPLWTFLILSAALIAIEITIILWLRNRYRYHRGAGLLYLFIFIGFILTISVVLMWRQSMEYGRAGSAVWLIIMACVFPLLVHSCWRLEQNGKIDGKIKRSGCHDATIGKTLGVIAWLIAILPIVRACYNITDNLLRDLLGIPDRFWPMLITVVLLNALNYGFVRLWFIVIRKCFHTMTNFAVNMVSAGAVFIIFMADLDVLNDFNGFLYGLSLFLMAISIGIFLGFFKSLREIRCANCHYFAGDFTGSTDYGYSTSSSDSWHDIPDHSISSSNIVRNARELRRTYTTMHNWTNHFRCEYCSNTWAIDESERVHSESHALERRWDEYS